MKTRYPLVAASLAAACSAALAGTEAANTPDATVPAHNCQVINSVENRAIGYEVAQDYNGQRFQTHVAQDPGDPIALNVSVTPQDGTVAVAPVATAPVLVVAPSVVYSAAAPHPYVGPYDGYYGYYG
jgi:uncharacterized protein YcfJ